MKPLAHGRPTRYAVTCADEDWDSDPEPLAEWRRMHALASMRAMVGTLAFVASYERGYRDGLRNALDDGWRAIAYLRGCPDEP